MAIGAARVMAAGKAGLESLPFFVDELLAQGIPQLAPWAIDHSQDQIDELQDRTQERVAGAWKDRFEIGVSPPGITMDTDTGPNRRLLQLENPRAAVAMELASASAVAELDLSGRGLAGSAANRPRFPASLPCVTDSHGQDTTWRPFTYLAAWLRSTR